MEVTFDEGRIDDAARLLLGIPEFENTPDAQAIRQRLEDVMHLVLTAHVHDETVACKIGYEREGKFYSWLGAVKPEYRTQTIATILADRQEAWAKQRGYTVIWMKTRNCFPEMLLMALRRGFRITGIEPREEIAQNRIILEKGV